MKSLQDQTSPVLCASVYWSPPQLPVSCSLPRSSRRSHTGLLIFCWCWHSSVEPGPGLAGWGRTQLVSASVTLLYPPAPPSAQYVTYLILLYHALFSRHQEKSWHVYIVLSDYINPGVHGGRGLIMSYPTYCTNQLIMLGVVNTQSGGKEQRGFTTIAVNLRTKSVKQTEKL